MLGGYDDPPAAGLPEARLTDALLARRPTLATARLLAIDGPAGSGKTTLAHRVETALTSAGCRAALLSLDDLYEGWTGLTPALDERVAAQVIEPLAAGRPARWRAADWAAGGFGDWHDLPLPDVLVLEGCGAGARRHAPYTTLLVWVEAAVTTRTERAVARDGVDVLAHWAAWAEAEERTFRTNDTRARADLRLHT